MTTRRGVLAGIAVVAAAAVCIILVQLGRTQPPIEPAPAAATPPPADQTYTGAKQCSSCHFKQYMAWKKTKHATDAFKCLAEKYQTAADCLKCHTTGYGAETGYKDASTPNLAGTTCEACHGPGSKHEAVAKQYANRKLSADEEKIVRGSIWRIQPQNVCIRCHTDQGHKAHPQYDKQ